MSKLEIYKASAGSGKTYTLTFEFLKLLFKQPDNFKRTLAVTFTNKACGEMKLRLLSELHKLAKHSPACTSGYMGDICKIFSLSQEAASAKADEILSSILHNYSLFSIETIDSFFQRIIQGFAKELGIYGGYTTEIDGQASIEKAIDLMFMEIDSHKGLSKWLVRFAEAKIIEGKSRNIAFELKAFASLLLTESYALIPDDIKAQYSDKEATSGYFRKLRAIELSYIAKIKELGVKAMSAIESSGLSISDFSYKESGAAGVFAKAAKGAEPKMGKRATDAMEDPQTWASKTSKKRNEIIALADNTLIPVLCSINKHIETDGRAAKTASMVCSNQYMLSLLDHISKSLYQYCEEENIVLLAGSNKLIKGLIDDNDAPFIYEKIGSSLENIMIDEFQDTSNMQWGNFKPLVANCMAQGGKAMVVGDVKQSIYRWRNGDWQILETQLPQDFPQMTNEKVLDSNWRSHKPVIDFNNFFFSESPQIMVQMAGAGTDAENSSTEDVHAQMIMQAYRNAHQKAPEKCSSSGYAEICISTGEGPKKEQALAYLAESIIKLQKAGYKAKDIAVLARSNTEIKAVADFLAEFKKNTALSQGCNFEIVSSEALSLNASAAVATIINILRYISDSKSPIPLIAAKQVIAQQRGMQGMGHQFYGRADRKAELLGQFAAQSHKLSLFELTEFIVQQLNLAELVDETPFIQALQDLINEFATKKNSSIASFLEWWDEKGYKKCLSVPDSQDAIKLLTIHKSKGLEFRCVILPFADWSITGKLSSTIWCRQETQPFAQLPIIPLAASKAMIETHFEQDFLIENAQSYLDSLNILYVAFTRAEECLLVHSSAGGSSSQKTSKLLETITLKASEITQNQQLIGTSIATVLHTPHNKVFSVGQLPQAIETADTKRENRLNMYPSYPFGKKIKLATNGSDFFSEMKENSRLMRKTGTAMHFIMEKTNTAADLEKAINKAAAAGYIRLSEKAEASRNIQSAISSAPEDWFNGSYSVINEQDLLLPGGQKKRPDRVMVKGTKAIAIDYKFTKQQSPRHISQMQEYCQILGSMGYDTQAYLWYINHNIIKKV
jgi:ATP-dependent helicase/nuclease subunit A